CPCQMIHGLRSSTPLAKSASTNAASSRWARRRYSLGCGAETCAAGLELPLTPTLSPQEGGEGAHEGDCCDRCCLAREAESLRYADYLQCAGDRRSDAAADRLHR